MQWDYREKPSLIKRSTFAEQHILQLQSCLRSVLEPML